ncbi:MULTISPECIES: TonB family protein [unclassified Chitinophaga]|uniref:TonB family protein n=1 Tax=unclassified Chitinophaga TaxID=2619133 RepID=UPI00301049B6
MPTLFIYILQASCAMTLFYLLYISCFKKETFYRYNRIVLLSAFIFSAALPLLPLPALRWTQKPTESASPVNVYFSDNAHASTQTTTSAIVSHWWDPLTQHAATILVTVYTAVVVLLLLLHLLQLLKIRRLVRAGNVYTRNNIRYVQLPGITAPFSFLRTIFFDPNAHAHTELQHVLKHEEAHVQQYHSADMLLSAFYCCICWINPFAWRCKRALQLNLEFLADEAVIQTTDAPDAYQYSLLKIGLAGSRVTIVNHFSKSFIKNRILMMNKTQSPRLRTWRYLLLLPVLALAAGLLAATAPSSAKNDAGSKYLATEKDQLYGVVTRLTTDEDFAVMKKVLLKKGITLHIPTLKRNENGEITDIEFKLTAERWSMKETSGNPFGTYFFYCFPKEGGIGAFPVKSCPQQLLDLALAESNGAVKGITTDSTFLNRFPGGESAYRKTFAKNVRYPRASQQSKAAGVVMLQYKIQPNGTINDIEVLQTPDKALGDEVKRVTGLLPTFAADPSGKTVTVSLRISFMLDNGAGGYIKGPDADNADVIVMGFLPKPISFIQPLALSFFDDPSSPC